MNFSIAGQPFLQALAADAHTLFFVLDNTGKIVDVNRCFTLRTGFNPEEAKQKYIWEFFLADNSLLPEVFSSHLLHADKPFFYAHYWLNIHKEPLYVEWSGLPFTEETTKVTFFICTGKDLSVYKSAQITLKQKEHKLEQLQRISKTGYWEHDLIKNTVSFSSQTAAIYSFPYIKGPIPAETHRINFSKKPYSLDEIYNLVPASEKEDFMSSLHRIMDACKPFQWTYTVEVNGIKKHIYVEGEFIFDASGKPVRLVGITQDITQKFEYEQKLKYKEKLLDTISEAVVATDTEFNITSWNKGAEKIYGWAACDVIGKNVVSILKTEFLKGSTYENALKEVNEKGIWFNRVIQRHKNGQLIHISSISNKVLDEKNTHIGFVAANRDISELVTIEEKLLTNQANLLAVIENTSDSIYLVDTDFRIMTMNTSCRQNFYKRFGVSIANGNKITDKLPAPVAENVEFTLKRALEGKQLIFEATYPDINQTEQIIECIVNPVKSESGQVVGIVVFTRNITERKKTQEEIVALKIASEKLRAAALLEGQETERRRLIKELHDGIGQMLHVLKLKIDTLKDNFLQINGPLEDITALVSQTISDVKSLVYDSMPYNLEQSGLEGAIRRLVEQYELNTRLQIQFQLWFNLINSSFEKTLEIYIYRILQECLNNIVKHAQATHVTIQLTQLPHSLLLMVEDDGIGFNLEEKLKQNGSSSGLKNLIERCSLFQAEIDIDTQVGHGCTINIIFPL